MNIISILIGQLAYVLFFVGFFFKETMWIRFYIMWGCAAAIIYALIAEREPLWVPLFWFSGFLVLNAIQYFFLKRKVKTEKIDPLETFLLKHVFSVFSPSDLRALIMVGIEGSVSNGEYLAKAGEPMKEIYCILQGTVTLMQDGVKCGVVGAGRLVGEMMLLGEQNSPYDILVSSDIKALAWSMENIEAWSAKSSKRLTLLQSAIGNQMVERIVSEKAAEKKSRKEQTLT